MTQMEYNDFHLFGRLVTGRLNNRQPFQSGE